MEDFAQLETEARNPNTAHLDELPTLDLVRTLHAENGAVLAAVQSVLPQVAQVVDIVAERLERGGRLFYVGAGTSGRLGVLDASECPPTFGVPREMVQGIIAGGTDALTRSIENAEDSPDAGNAVIEEFGVTSHDVVIGIAASGRTPFVQGALEAARQRGAATVALANVSQPAIGTHADIVLAAVTGAESLTGSTRLKAGTAQKLILNLITTGAMVRLGKVYGNLMVDVRATNAKLRDRAIRIVMAATSAAREAAETALAQAGGECKVAIVMLKRQISADEAAELLAQTGGRITPALQLL
jgi:N-acetylmuramic acid 6-phosphate etherase